MIELNIPQRGSIQLDHLVCDVNGTLAIDGVLPDGLVKKLQQLQDRLTIHLLTADTHGKQHTIDRELSMQAVRLLPGSGDTQKESFVQNLGPERVIAIGQGENDHLMLKSAAIGIAVLSQEGLSPKTLLAADILVPDIFSAIELLHHPMRIVATLRK